MALKTSITATQTDVNLLMKIQEILMENVISRCSTRVIPLILTLLSGIKPLLNLTYLASLVSRFQGKILGHFYFQPSKTLNSRAVTKFMSRFLLRKPVDSTSNLKLSIILSKMKWQSSPFSKSIIQLLGKFLSLRMEAVISAVSTTILQLSTCSHLSTKYSDRLKKTGINVPF